MSDTINEFGKFISEDPIMLILCVSVVVLIIVFILVLCFGGKKKKKEESNVTENTSQFLKSDLNDEPLKSTQEFSLNHLEEASIEESALAQTINVPNVNAFAEETLEKEAPISVDEALNLKNERVENELKDTIPVPIVSADTEVPVELPKSPTNPEVSNTLDILSTEAPSEPVIPEVTQVESAEPVLEDVELPSMTAELQPVNTNTTSMQPFSSVYLNSSDEIPKISNDEFSQTEIIKHIPVVEEESKLDSAPEMPVINETQPANDIDDLDLPKLNKDEKNSVLSSLTGESFDI